ncbi:IS4 family transposase [Ktedonobacter sp. SOSP1-52]|uniref:IS1634 family transposase n=1 Tax=Ktedonobacter sp. SOSP1-52 TaxID=2778366 RepID=UPI00191607FE|nr:IS1634 family transposase [Ktedonobacter sp. SOSP1-52]GHO71564.1 IS4 family transposase [Ktedonobacter sp. SOSP1-52]
MQREERYVNERLDHLGVVAGVCEEIGLATYLDRRAGQTKQHVSVGTATVAMILNGLGFSNRRLYLVPQFFANKPVEHLLGPGVEATDLNDDCLGRTLDWLYAHDPTQLFAGIAKQARQVFGVSARHVHVDTTSFAVSGAYERDEKEKGEGEASMIAITYGYSRDHREDLKQWMLALATTQEGDVPLFLRPLDGNSSDKATLASAVEALHEQLHAPESDPSFFVADSGIYSEANMRSFNEAKILWVSRVPETSKEAKAMLERALDQAEWQVSADGQTHWFTRTVLLPQGEERWIVVRTEQGETRAQATFQRQGEKIKHNWQQKLWHLSNQRFACQADAEAALQRELKGLPPWLDVQHELVSSEHHSGKGRPRKGVAPLLQWHTKATVTVNQQHAEQAIRRKACFIVATNALDSAVFSEQEIMTLYKAQGSVERGFRFLKDPLFLASSVFVKKPERIVALGLLMVLCLLVYRLAEYRLRTRLAETEQTLPDQLNRPTTRPTMRWIFQCFEGIELLHIHSTFGTQPLVLRLKPLHRLVLTLLGPPYEKIYKISS